MKKLTYALFFVLALAACQHTPATELKEQLLLIPPPAIRADAKGYRASEKQLMTVRQNAPADRVSDVQLSAPSAAPPKNSAIDTSKKITKEGDIHFETADVVKTRKAIIYAVQQAGGYVSEDSQSRDESLDRKEYVLKVRIPAKNFDFLVDTVSASADKIDSKNISIKDVTTQYIDMKTRLENKQKLEHTYLGLLTQAKRMADVLQIEEKITEIRSDIESSQGELNYLVKQVAYSSFDITFYNKAVSHESASGFGDKLISAIAGGWDALQNLFFYLISVWPIVAIVLGAYVLIIRRRRKKISAE
jgi:hypothetical protein